MLFVDDCALDTDIVPPSRTTKVVSFKVTRFMRFFLSWLGRTPLYKRKVLNGCDVVKIVVLFIRTTNL